MSSSSQESFHRLPQVGDIVTITYKGQTFTRNITDIKANIIYFTDSTIIWENNRWEFPNGHPVNNIRFIRSKEERLQNSVFTGSQLTDMHVLAEADDKTFDNLCQTNLRLRDICTNPKYQARLYEMRVQARFLQYYRLFGDSWGQFLNEDQLSKVTKPTWKEIYQNLVKIERINALSLLAGYGEGVMETLGEYPEIVKFVYPVNPAPFSYYIKAYANYVWVDTPIYDPNIVWVKIPRKWKGLPEILRWLLELNELEPTPALLSNAVRLGYGPFIRYLVEEKGLILSRNGASIALFSGAGDIWDLVKKVRGEDMPDDNTEMSGMGNALKKGNIEGLEAFQRRGFRLSVHWIENNVKSYPKDTIKWLRDNGYEYASSPAFRKMIMDENNYDIVKAIKELDKSVSDRLSPAKQQERSK